jgi:hypothetical protein
MINKNYKITCGKKSLQIFWMEDWGDIWNTNFEEHTGQTSASDIAIPKAFSTINV